MTTETLAPPLTRAERVLLARVHRWARRKAGYWPVWERGILPGMWHTRPRDGLWIEVAFGPNNGGRLSVEVKTGRWGELLLDEAVSPRSVREAVDLLVAWQILPAQFSSAHTAATRRRSTTARCRTRRAT